MRRYWSRFVAPLKPGTRGLLAVLALAYGAAVIGEISGAFNLYKWLGLSSAEFWRGRVWEIVTYAVIPAGIADLIFNGFMIAWIGTWLERAWPASELWIYCFISALAAGVARVLLLPSSQTVMAGSAAILFGLLAAWAFLFGHEKVLLMGIWDIPVKSVALLLGGVSLLVMLPCDGPVNAFILLCGGLGGWGYLELRKKHALSPRSRILHSERIRQLEL
jgi:membrane associated rhomboid family serine protease